MTGTPAVGVVGAGAWGTALAVALARAGQAVALWGRDVEALVLARENAAYLPGIAFPQNLAVVQHLEALRGCAPILLVVPAQTIRAVCRELAAHVEPGARLVICAKGIERDSGKLLAAVVREEIPEAIPAVLSGPSFAAEVGRGLPTAATLAADNETIASALALSLSTPMLRVYHTTDLIGVELTSALKNVVAIACGIVAGRGLGENARAAVMTRGLAEITRLVLRMGGRAETLMGLAGFGDVALTCSSRQSRNYSLGCHIGEGMDVTIAGAGRLTEGAATSGAVLTLAAAQGLEMPIAAAVHAILTGRLTIDGAVGDLMGRPLKAEA